MSKLNENSKSTRSIWLRSRSEAGKSQEYMASKMGIARKTVQNWEKGVSEPSVSQAFEWFRVLNVTPLPYLFQYVFPTMENIKGSDDDKKIRAALNLIIDDLPPEGVRQLLYLFYGDHGSSPRAVMNMVNAHLQCPMKDRICHGSMIAQNYELAQRMNLLTSTEHIQPNMNLLHKAIKEGEDATVAGHKVYSLDTITP